MAKFSRVTNYKTTTRTAIYVTERGSKWTARQTVLLPPGMCEDAYDVRVFTYDEAMSY